MNEKTFVSEFLLDKQTVKKIKMGEPLVSKGYVLLQYIFIFSTLILVINGFSFEREGRLLKLYCVFLIAFYLFFRHNNIRLFYKRLLFNNNDKIPTERVTVDENGIVTQIVDSGNHASFSFDKIKRIAENEDFLYAQLQHNQYIYLSKNHLTGGTADELKAYLFEKCTNLKKRKIVKKRPYVVRSVIVLVLLLIFVLMHTVLPLSFLGLKRMNDAFDEKQFDKQGVLSDAAFSEIAVVLENLEFNPIVADIISNCEEYLKYDESLDHCMVMLYDMGFPEWVWVEEEEDYQCRYSKDVYSIDGCCERYENFYFDYVQGIAALCDDITFTEMEENFRVSFYCSDFDVSVCSFSVNGTEYHVKACDICPLLDFRLLNTMADIVRENSPSGKQLYFLTDGYQFLSIFYRDAAWAETFEKTTGLELFTEFEER